MNIRTLKDIDIKGKTVLYRADLNVPMKAGGVEDASRITRLVPTIKELLRQNAKVVIMSHFGRPEGEFVRELSLAPIANVLSEALDGIEVKFSLDCIGEEAEEAVKSLRHGQILLLENLRFHAGETKNSKAFTEKLASLGDVYVNDTFSCSHRKHSSIVGLAEMLPSAAGLLLQHEIESLELVLNSKKSPIAAVVGGAKVSTKLTMLESLIKKVDLIVIGGAMANTFLKSQGYNIGKSLYEPELVDTAKKVIEKSAKANCRIYLPVDVVVAKELKDKVECEILPVDKVRNQDLILDIGPATVVELNTILSGYKTLVWNGPLGAFEYRPFDIGTSSLARIVASLTKFNGLTSVAGGGDIVSALKYAGLTNSFSYISTAGGAFLEWLEGKELPGIAALRK